MSPMAHATAMFAITVSVLVWTLGQVQGHSATTFAFANTSDHTASPDTVDSGKQEKLWFKNNYVYLYFLAIITFSKLLILSMAYGLSFSLVQRGDQQQEEAPKTQVRGHRTEETCSQLLFCSKWRPGRRGRVSLMISTRRREARRVTPTTLCVVSAALTRAPGTWSRSSTASPTSSRGSSTKTRSASWTLPVETCSGCRSSWARGRMSSSPATIFRIPTMFAVSCCLAFSLAYLIDVPFSNCLCLKEFYI